MILKAKNLGLFMTRGMSLSKWDKIGMLAREIKPYQKLAEFFKEIYIFTYGDNTDIQYLKLFPENVKIIVKPRFLPSSIYSFLLPIIHTGKLKNIHILKTNQMDGSWSAVISKKLFGNKLVVRCGYEWLQTIEKSKKFFMKRFIAYYVEKFAYSNADKIILTADESKRFVMSRFDLKPELIQIIPNYIDVDLFKPSDVLRDRRRVIFMGRLEKQKNLINLLHALKGLDLKLVIIGTGSLEAEIERIAREYKIHFEFKGNIPQADIPIELNKSEIFVLPSLYEGNPKVLLEAMSCGLPCIGADVEGINSVISHMENGLLSSTDPDSIRGAISKLLGDKELCVKLGINARRNIETNNSFGVFIEKELSVFQSV